ncbi:histidinol-phosphatase HisJ [Companilactobacillus ginsenosidimutans]|uniref:Histidinol-phosphatase n=1 Tax=Companilactobacillus ginsenosidimutans TaxID=1007676 RepID=A0A0H4QIE4_9LACO|nr:histidinol-phosphatase HisJ [Companilactobacillus ginsenosidimutans]AKP67717.1 histidinol phosphatase [Companilactobacillus ginsenosidimutans]
MLSHQEFQEICCNYWNGHTHTEFCPHGSHEDTEDFIRQAINAGFKTYSITEHFPMPPQFYRMADGSKHAIDTAAMDYSELQAYFEKMEYLKAKYADQIRILVGFEFDYIDGCQEWTRSKLEEFGDKIDDAILSVHFLPTDGGLRSVDDNYEDFCDGVLRYYKTPVGVANKYLSTVLDAVKWSCDDKPARYGHITLYRKWRKQFKSDTAWSDTTTDHLIDKILKHVAKKNEMLDCNMSGLAKFSQCESSPYVSIIEKAADRGIKLIYGSDAHETSNVDQGLNEYLVQKLCKCGRV